MRRRWFFPARTVSFLANTMNGHGLVLIVSGIFLADIVLGKSVNSPSDTKDLYEHPYSCRCSASVEGSSKAQHDLGTVKLITLRKDTDGPKHDVSLGETSPCHALRHRCHKACSKVVENLEYKIHKNEAHGSMETLGFKLCSQHAQNTPKGGLSVVAQASLHAPHCPDHGDLLKPVKLTSNGANKLCCGHVYIAPEQNAPPVSAFGWNPDCLAVKYVFGY